MIYWYLFSVGVLLCLRLLAFVLLLWIVNLFVLFAAGIALWLVVALCLIVCLMFAGWLFVG